MAPAAALSAGALAAALPAGYTAAGVPAAAAKTTKATAALDGAVLRVVRTVMAQRATPADMAQAGVTLAGDVVLPVGWAPIEQGENVIGNAAAPRAVLEDRQHGEAPQTAAPSDGASRPAGDHRLVAITRQQQVRCNAGQGEPDASSPSKAGYVAAAAGI